MKKEARNKLTKLVITNILCQSLGPSLYRGSTVLNFIFQKVWGGELAPPAPPSARALTVGSGIKTTILGQSGQAMTSTDQAEGTYHQR